MKSKTKLVYSNYDPESGISIARIQTPYGTFKGKARVHPKEADIASRLDAHENYPVAIDQIIYDLKYKEKKK